MRRDSLSAIVKPASARGASSPVFCLPLTLQVADLPPDAFLFSRHAVLPICRLKSFAKPTAPTWTGI